MLSDRLEPFRRIARHLPYAMALGRRLHVLLDPELRTVARLKRRQGQGVFQHWPHTEVDRYPQLFDALAERLSGIEAPRILSFGCSSGEEVRALRQRLPQARITGVDTNPRAIARARKADADGRYLLAELPPAGEQFDAVLALAVLRHGDLEAFAPEDCSAVMPFARFAEGVAMLEAALAPGGWLAIFNAHFRFADTDTAARYDVDPLRLTDHVAPDVIWGPDNRRLHRQPYGEVLFRKLRDC